ncbi:MAG: transporter [Sphingomonadales bacterium]|nr:transporter [Sphingomonadales bacterium]
MAVPTLRPLRSPWIFAATLAVLALPGVARADSLRSYCPDRPGMNTPPCTIDAGHPSAELSWFDWTRANDAAARTDTVLIGDMALRYGIDGRTELRLGWTAYGHVRSRDKASGTVTTASGVGDVTLGIKRNLVGPDMSGFSLALLPAVSLPAGGTAIGAGDWGAGLQAPMSLPLAGPVSLAVTPEVDAAVNAGGHGRHLAYGTAAGLAIAASTRVNLALEMSVLHDDDPAGASTSATAGVAAGLMLGKATQIDIAGEFGLDHAAPGLRLYAGIARRF